MRRWSRREVIAGAATWAIWPMLSYAKPTRFDAIVGAGGYASIQAALDAAPKAGLQPFRILIKRGVWREKLVIEKSFIHLIGESRANTILSFDAYAGGMAPDGAPWGTFRTPTVAVRAPDFSATNLTIENAFDYRTYLSKAQGEPTGPNRAQAVALSLDEASDRALLQNVNIAGFQDTLLVNAGRCWFRNCRISGTVDFIFGAACSYFESCEIVSRYRAGQQKQGYIAAPSTLASQEFGLIFHGCRLIKEKAAPPRSVSLARPWRPTRSFSDGRYGDPNVVGKAVFIDCWLGDHIEEQGWDAMDYGARDGSRAQFKPEDARFFEFGNRGPGAIQARSVQRRMLSSAEARLYRRQNVLGDWAFATRSMAASAE